MSSKSETGHAKNVYNFQNLIMHVDSLGSAYNPSKNELKISNLKIQHKSAAESLLALASAMPHYQQAVDAREIAFSSLSKLVTRALNMFKASVFNQPEVESAVSVSKKIRGFKASKPKPAQEGTTIKTISISQRSYDMLIANFQVFIEILAAHQTYQPNEEDLKIASLNSKLEDLTVKSEAVTIAQTNADIARSNRNNLLYDKGTGLVDVSSGVKTYIRAAFSPNTPNYKPLLSLEFRKPKM